MRGHYFYPSQQTWLLFANTEQAQKQGGRGEQAFPSLYVYAAKRKGALIQP